MRRWLGTVVGLIIAASTLVGTQPASAGATYETTGTSSYANFGGQYGLGIVGVLNAIAPEQCSLRRKVLFVADPEGQVGSAVTDEEGQFAGAYSGVPSAVEVVVPQRRFGPNGSKVCTRLVMEPGGIG